MISEQNEKIGSDRLLAGARETVRALKRGRAAAVYIASDADKSVTAPVEAAAENASVRIIYIDSMAELGKSCKIARPASAAARL